MCEKLSELREAMQRYAAGFDPALLAAADAARVVEDAPAIEKMAGTVKTPYGSSCQGLWMIALRS